MFCWLREDLTGSNVFSLREKLQTSSVARPKQIQNRLKLSLVFWSLYCQSLHCFGGLLLYGESVKKWSVDDAYDALHHI